MPPIFLHIPHSSTKIPTMEGFTNQKLVHQEINLLTDWYTDKLFDIPGNCKLITPWSRVYCDVERFKEDKHEPMASFGRGAVYTNTHSGKKLRVVSKELKNHILKKYYDTHHLKLYKYVRNLLKVNGSVTIVDCHSFPAVSCLPEISCHNSFPDFCIGTDPFHTPIDLTLKAKMFLESQGYTVWIDNPYTGCMVPTAYYKKDRAVNSIMIEVNRSLYMANNPLDDPEVSEGFDRTRTVLLNLIKLLNEIG